MPKGFLSTGRLSHVTLPSPCPRGSHPKTRLGLDKALSCLSPPTFLDLPVATSATPST